MEEVEGCAYRRGMSADLATLHVTSFKGKYQIFCKMLDPLVLGQMKIDQHIINILRHIGLLEVDEDKIRKIRPKGTQVRMLYVPREAIRP